MPQETSELSSCPVHLCFSLLITSFHMSGSQKNKTKTIKLNFTLKFWLYFLFFFSFFFFGLNRTHKMSSSPVFKVMEYKVIRTLDINEKETGNMFREHVFVLFVFLNKLYQFFWVVKFTSYQPTNQHKLSLQSTRPFVSHWPKTPSKEWISFSGLWI